MKAPDITLILPAYNEVSAIGGAIGEVRAYFSDRGRRCEIIVSADGDDGTREKVAELAAGDPDLKVMGYKERSGKGRGIRESVAIATGRIVGFADADRKVNIAEFEKIEPWLDQNFDVVIGSRVRKNVGKPQPLHRRVGSWGFSYFMQFVVGLPGIRDTQCGFKFFPLEVARKIFGMQKIDGYMFDVEILALAQRLGYRIKEVPVHWSDDGDSRLDLFAGNLRNAADIFRIRGLVRSLNGDKRES